MTVIRPELGIERMTRLAVTGAAYIAGFVLLALMLLTVADVAARYFLNSPITGVFDLTHFAVQIMVFFGLSYCGYQGGHVVIELLYDKLAPVPADVLVRLINFAGAILYFIIAWRLWVQSIDVQDFKESSQLLLIPFHPFYWAIALGSLLFSWVMLLRVFIPEPGHQPKS